MANLLAKAIRLKKKEFALKTRLLGLPKGSLCYILKRDGKIKPFTILAVMAFWNEDFSNYRTSKTFLFAAYADEVFRPFFTSRSMENISAIATHIAVVKPNGDTHCYAIRKGDEWTPYFFDWTYTFFAVSCSDIFVPAECEDHIMWEYKADNFTAVVHHLYQVDTTAASITVTLPPAPLVGESVQIEDAALTWHLYNVILNRNGKKINSLTDNYTAGVVGGKLSLVYVSDAIGWSVK